jgi:hypothetical protein
MDRRGRYMAGALSCSSVRDARRLAPASLKSACVPKPKTYPCVANATAHPGVNLTIDPVKNSIVDAAKHRRPFFATGL